MKKSNMYYIITLLVVGAAYSVHCMEAGPSEASRDLGRQPGQYIPLGRFNAILPKDAGVRKVYAKSLELLNQAIRNDDSEGIRDGLTSVQSMLYQDAVRAAGSGDLEQLKKHITADNLASFELGFLGKNNFYWAVILITADENDQYEIIDFLRTHPRFASIKAKARELNPDLSVE